VIAKHLINMLKEDKFIWTDTTKQAFEEQEKLMSSIPVLALPDFLKVFVAKVDNHPIAFISRNFNKQ